MLGVGYVALVKMTEYDLSLATGRQIAVEEVDRRTVEIACGKRVVEALPADCVKRREWINCRRLSVNVILPDA